MPTIDRRATLGVVCVNNRGELSFEINKKAWEEARLTFAALPPCPRAEPCEIIINDTRCEGGFNFPRTGLRDE